MTVQVYHYWFQSSLYRNGSLKSYEDSIHKRFKLIKNDVNSVHQETKGLFWFLKQSTKAFPHPAGQVWDSNEWHISLL